MTKVETQPKETAIQAMFDVGAHYGHMKARRHPSARTFVFGAKNRVEIFDLEKTADALETAKQKMRKLGAEKATVLFLGGKNEAHVVIRKVGEELNMPYVAGRWVGGTLTNFELIRSRIEKLLNLRSQKEKGELATKYTKRELLWIDREIERLEKNFGGLTNLSKLPKAIVVVDPKRESNAMREAETLKIPTIGLCSSDCNLDEVTCAIPANDASRASITYFIEELARAYKEGEKLSA